MQVEVMDYYMSNKDDAGKKIYNAENTSYLKYD